MSWLTWIDVKLRWPDWMTQ